MEGGKEYFLDMREKEWLVIMSDTLYCSIDPSLRRLFKNEVVAYKDEHKILIETNQDYRDTYKTYREAKKALNEHKKILRDKHRNGTK